MPTVAGWLFWLILAGRGWGKTRTGAETVRQWAENPRERILLVAPTAADVREVMIEGPSGLLACYPANRRPIYNSSRHLITFPSGAIGITRSADEPERLRGPQFSKFWADELCAWRFLKEAWVQLSFGFRIKTDLPLQGLITTTPKPSDVLKEIMGDSATIVTGGSSYENRSNLSEIFYQKVIKPWEGTRLGSQEIYGQLLMDVKGALWTMAMIEAARVTRRPNMVRVVVGVDPAVSAKDDSDLTGIVVVGFGVDGHLYILEDASGRYTPDEWAAKVVEVASRWQADSIVGEVNNGGDLVQANLRHAPGGQWLAFRAVHASRGKQTRAEPVAAIFERGLAHTVIPLVMDVLEDGSEVWRKDTTAMQPLEQQLTTWVPGGGERSPDRMDAMVWAVWHMVIEPQQVEQSQEFAEHVQISPV